MLKEENWIYWIKSYYDELAINPNMLSFEDWIYWNPLIRQACSVVDDPQLRDMGLKAIHGFEQHFFKASC